jgi:hypothetical protein
MRYVDIRGKKSDKCVDLENRNRAEIGVTAWIRKSRITTNRTRECTEYRSPLGREVIIVNWAGFALGW